MPIVGLVFNSNSAKSPSRSGDNFPILPAFRFFGCPRLQRLRLFWHVSLRVFLLRWRLHNHSNVPTIQSTCELATFRGFLPFIAIPVFPRFISGKYPQCQIFPGFMGISSLLLHQATSPANKHETGETCFLTSVATSRSFQCPRNSEHQRLRNFSRFFAFHSRFGFSRFISGKYPQSQILSGLVGSSSLTFFLTAPPAYFSGMFAALRHSFSRPATDATKRHHSSLFRLFSFFCL